MFISNMNTKQMCHNVINIFYVTADFKSFFIIKNIK